MEPEALAANPVIHDEQRIDIAAELSNIDQDSWEFSQVDTDNGEGRFVDYSVSVRTSEDMLARRYVFTVKFDRLRVAGVGTPVLEIFDSYNDNWKPVDTLIRKIDGRDAEALFNIVRRSSQNIVEE